MEALSHRVGYGNIKQSWVVGKGGGGAKTQVQPVLIRPPFHRPAKTASLFPGAIRYGGVGLQARLFFIQLSTIIIYSLLSWPGRHCHCQLLNG